MAHTDSEYTQHVSRMHNRRLDVAAAAAQLADAAAKIVADHNAARPGSDTTTGPLRAGNETRNE